MRVTRDVLLQLEQCECDGGLLRLSGQLDRSLYVAVNKVLAAAGGKWNRKAQAHVFPYPAADVIDQIILTGQVTSQQQALGWFPTPPPVLKMLLDLADLKPEMLALEPSAGDGAIAEVLTAAGCTVNCIEIDPRRAEALYGRGWNLQVGDFLSFEPGALPPYDRVVMNPPFAKQEDITHVTHALRFLRPGGLLVSVMSVSVTYRQNKAATAFRDLAERAGGRFAPVPDGSFKVSGTGVSTVIAVIPALT